MSFVKSVTPELQNVLHSSPLEHTSRTGVSGAIHWNASEDVRMQYIHSQRNNTGVWWLKFSSVYNYLAELLLVIVQYNNYVYFELDYVTTIMQKKL